MPVPPSTVAEVRELLKAVQSAPRRDGTEIYRRAALVQLQRALRTESVVRAAAILEHARLHISWLV